MWYVAIWLDSNGTELVKTELRDVSVDLLNERFRLVQEVGMAHAIIGQIACEKSFKETKKQFISHFVLDKCGAGSGRQKNGRFCINNVCASFEGKDPWENSEPYLEVTEYWTGICDTSACWENGCKLIQSKRRERIQMDKFFLDSWMCANCLRGTHNRDSSFRVVLVVVRSSIVGWIVIS